MLSVPPDGAVVRNARYARTGDELRDRGVVKWPVSGKSRQNLGRISANLGEISANLDGSQRNSANLDESRRNLVESRRMSAKSRRISTNLNESRRISANLDEISTNFDESRRHLDANLDENLGLDYRLSSRGEHHPSTAHFLLRSLWRPPPCLGKERTTSVKILAG